MRSARFSVFLAPDAQLPPNLWTVVIGGDPENSVVQKTLGLMNENGPFAEGRIGFLAAPGRVDWVYEPVDTLAEPERRTLGAFPDALTPFVAAMNGWVRSNEFPAVHRLAVGFELLEPTADRATGYEALRHFIDAVPAGDASDFIYQVNRPRASLVIEGITINRLAKWSVMLFRAVVLTQAAAPTVTATRTYLSLDLDVNTSAEVTTPLRRDSVERILGELVAAAEDVSVRGDRLGER